MKDNQQKDRENRLFAIASHQQSYFTARQTKVAGYSYRLQHFHKTVGNWNNIDRGLYRLRNYVDSPFEDLVRWSFWSRNSADVPQAVISHQTALAVFGLGDLMPARIHLTVPPRFYKKSEACVLYRKIIPPDDVEAREGFFITKPVRTVLDVAEDVISPDELEKVIRDGIRAGYFVRDDLVRRTVSPEARRRLETALENIK